MYACTINVLYIDIFLIEVKRSQNKAETARFVTLCYNNKCNQYPPKVRIVFISIHSVREPIFNKAIRDGKYLDPSQASDWQRSPH